jgi:hypothetical protein
MDHEGGAFKVKEPDWGPRQRCSARNHAVKIDIVTKIRLRNVPFAENVCRSHGYEMGMNALFH